MNKRLALTTDVQRVLKDELANFIKNELGEDFGDLKVQLTCDFIAEKFAPVYYNCGVRDAVAFMSDKLDDVYHLEF